MNKTLRRIIIGAGAISLSLAAAFTLTSCNEGMSAYEIAVENGYEGTEEEWLISLQGSDGSDGSDAETETTYDMYEALVNSGEYSGTYSEFLKEYIGGNYDLSYLMNKSLLSTVSITMNFEVQQMSGFRPGSSSSSITTETYAGSGVIYEVDTNEGDAYIITAYHNIYNSDSITSDNICTDITCYLYGDDDGMTAQYIGGDISTDIAILKIDDSDVLKDNQYVTSVTFGEYDNLYIGETVYAVGNNYGEGISANAGTLSLLSYDCTYEIDDYTATVRSFRYDAATNSGNSGGGVYNEYGELIGIVNCKMESTGVEGMQYAVPVSVFEGLAYKVVSNYEKNNTTTNSKVSLQAEYSDTNSTVYLNTATGMYNSKSEVVVESLTSGGVLQDAGLIEGDVITSLELNPNGANRHSKQILHSYDIDEFLYWANKDDTLAINYTRNGLEMSTTITLSYSYTM